MCTVLGDTGHPLKEVNTMVWLADNWEAIMSIINMIGLIIVGKSKGKS